MRNHLMVVLLVLAGALTCTGCPKDAASGTNTKTSATAAAPTPSATASTPAKPDNLPAGAADAPIASQEPTKYVPPTPHGEADTPKPADTTGTAAPGSNQNSSHDMSPVASVTGRDTNSINSGKVETVVLETTKGKIGIDVHTKWGEQGATQFLHLVNVGFYDGAPWYRVISGFAAQSGIAADPTVNAKWQINKIMDDNRVKSNNPGTVSFAQHGPRTRSCYFFINLSDNTTLLDDKGYVPFGIVSSGMEVAQNLTPISDKQLSAAGLSQETLAKPGGMDAFKRAFPKADYIIKAYVLK